MIGELNHPSKEPKLEIMHNCPEIFEKMFGNCEQVKLTKLTDDVIKHGHFEPTTNNCFTLVQN